MTQTKRIRFGVKAMQAMKQEVAIRNQVIENLEADLAICLSEKLRLGETNAWLTEQNDALKKEVHLANVDWQTAHEKVETTQKAWKKDHSEYQAKTIQLEKQLSDFFIIMEKDQAQTALSLYIWKAVAVVAVVADLVLAFILLY
jgi:hypothetical protein